MLISDEMAAPVFEKPVLLRHDGDICCRAYLLGLLRSPSVGSGIDCGASCNLLRAAESVFLPLLSALECILHKHSVGGQNDKGETPLFEKNRQTGGMMLISLASKENYEVRFSLSVCQSG